MAAGVRFKVETDADWIEAEILAGEGSTSPVDVIVDGILHSRIPISRPTRVRVSLPAGVHRVELWLPQFGEIAVGPVRLAGAARVVPVQDGLRWAAYGSSITQCREAHGPSDTWPAWIDRFLGWSHTNLGFAGQCHLDPPARRTLATADVELLLACIGINIYEASTFGPRGLAAQLGGFLVDLATVQPDLPIVLVSPIPSPSRENRANSVGLTLAEVRKIVEDVGRTLASGRSRFSWISGPELLGHDEAADLLPDGLHPAQEGMLVIAERLSSRLGSVTLHHRPRLHDVIE
nr:SGNH/GDSL hydrolase family protein [Microbacterium immunditiarum]